ncbi:MAG: hypothetical protein HY308_18000 [Gammaproteobacteria bacterium]|nr:hypothetical protein [Gammaproteobacteria bacterium]
MSNRNTVLSFGLSAAVTSVLTVLLVVAKETNESLMTWMKAVSGHHWITHGILTVLVFVALGFILARFQPSKRSWINESGLALLVGATTVVSGLLLFGFFLMRG